MGNVIGVRFQNAGKLYFFDPCEFWPTSGDFVVVETARGIEFGEVVVGVHEINDELLTVPLKPVIRIASEEDIHQVEENKRREKEAYAICQKKILEHKLDMKLVSVEYTFDNSKILFYFTANGRVDFRSLVKDLAAVFKTRIELRQIGVRDEAKMLGGLGPCGRPICCGTFLGDFQPVSIKMAKDQNLSLNPTKISGICGRLMCCLKYEEDTYEQIRKQMPKIGREVMTPDGPGVVWDLNIIKETVRIRIQKGDSSELRDYPIEDVQRTGNRPMIQQNHSHAEKTELDEDNASASPEQEQVLSEMVAEEQMAVDEQSAAAIEAEEPKPAEHANRPARKHEDRRESGNRERSARDGQKKNREPRENREPKPVHEVKEQKPQVPSKPQEAAPEKPAQPVSPWKKAVEQALKAARGEGTAEPAKTAEPAEETEG